MGRLFGRGRRVKGKVFLVLLFGCFFVCIIF